MKTTGWAGDLGRSVDETTEIELLDHAAREAMKVLMLVSSRSWTSPLETPELEAVVGNTSYEFAFALVMARRKILASGEMTRRFSSRRDWIKGERRKSTDPFMGCNVRLSHSIQPPRRQSDRRRDDRPDFSEVE